MSYYKVKVNRYATALQSYYVSINTDCPEHAKEMATEVLEAYLDGKSHELSGFDPEEIDEPRFIEDELEVDETSEPHLCEYTEDLFIK